jgi:hypothetical protein
MFLAVDQDSTAYQAGQLIGEIVIMAIAVGVVVAVFRGIRRG